MNGADPFQAVEPDVKVSAHSIGAWFPQVNNLFRLLADWGLLQTPTFEEGLRAVVDWFGGFLDEPCQAALLVHDPCSPTNLQWKPLWPNRTDRAGFWWDHSDGGDREIGTTGTSGPTRTASCASRCGS